MRCTNIGSNGFIYAKEAEKSDDRINVKKFSLLLRHTPVRSAKGYKKPNDVHEKSFKFLINTANPPTHQAASVEDESTLLLLWKYLRAWINDSRRFSRKHMHKEREKLFIIGTNTIESKVIKKKVPSNAKGRAEMHKWRRLRLMV